MSDRDDDTFLTGDFAAEIWATGGRVTRLLSAKEIAANWGRVVEPWLEPSFVMRWTLDLGWQWRAHAEAVVGLFQAIRYWRLRSEPCERTFEIWMHHPDGSGDVLVLSNGGQRRVTPSDPTWPFYKLHDARG